MASTSSEEEQQEKEVRKSLQKVERKRCYMHLLNVKNEDVLDFTCQRWDTYRACLKQWLCLHGINRDLAEIYRHCQDIEFDNIPIDAGFHTTCYRRFTDKQKLVRAEKQSAQIGNTSETPSTSALPEATTTEVAEQSETPRKKLRSRSGLAIASAGPVLPAICIICKRATKYIRVAALQKRDSLVQAETLTAGRLMKAAEIKKDYSILLHIKDKDCVALEVRYHKTCYRDYTRFLAKTPAEETESRDEEIQSYDESYKVFCEQVIRQRIFVDKDVLRMDKLRRLFINTIQKYEDPDLSDYRQDLLKRRLRRDFPQLVFHTPFQRNTSEIVFVESATDKLLDLVPQSSGTSESTEVSQESDSSNLASPPYGQTTSEHTRTLYNAGLILKNILNDAPGMQCLWPPTAVNESSSI